MCRTKKLTCGLLIASCLLLSGCGEKLTELTAEEEDIITLYAAKVVAKHNVRLSQGIVRYKGNLDEDEEEAEDTAGEDASDEEATEEEETSDTADTDSGTQEDTEEAEEVAAKPVTLTKAMGIDGIAFTYEGAAVPESLRLSSYYTLPDPAAGKQYVIAGYRLTNKTDSPINVSIAQMRPVFTATIGDESVNAGIVLEDDLSTYEGTVEAGGNEDLILLFEVSEAAASDLSDLSLAVNVNGQNTPLLLK